MKYPLAKPDLTGNESKYVNECLESGWLSWTGRFVDDLERSWAKHCGTKYAVATTSGTTALTLAVASLRIGPGDEVIVPEFTMVASAFAVSAMGARPVFVDCGDDLNIDVNKIEEKITPRTRAIMPVHIYGRPANMKRILEIAHEYNLDVIEDAAEAHGASIDGRKVGSFGDVGCFSLFSNKIIVAGEGGLVTTNSQRLYTQMKHLNRMAFDPDHTFLHKKLAYNFVMPNMSAAVALAQIERIDELLAKREKIKQWYDERLGKYTLYRPKGSVLWYYDIVLPEHISNDWMVERLEEHGIETRRFFKPMSMQGHYLSEYDHLKAYEFSKRGLYLPTHPDMTKEDVANISQAVVDNIFND